MSLTLQQIEAELTQLRQLIARDELATNAYNLNSKGELEEKLTGHLEAKGVTLPAGANFTASSATIEWIDAGAAKIAEVIAVEEPERETLMLRAGPVPGTYADIQIIGGARPSVTAAAVGGSDLTIIDGENNSDFLRIAHPPGLTAASISWGEGTVQWPEGEEGSIGGFIGSGVEHHLKTVPSFFGAALVEGGEIFYETNPVGITTLDETYANFAWSINTKITPDATATAVWFAIG